MLSLLLLAIVQGLTEALPVSSSGHLVVLEGLLGISEDQAALNIVLHFGTLLAVIVYYARDLKRLLFENRQVILALIVGTIPAGVIGIGIKEFADHLVESPLIAGFCLPVTGIVLLWVRRQPDQDFDYSSITLRAAFLIGCAQAVAILPGISRSGMTIAAGMALGLRPSSAARFSFLLAIPAIGGATFLQAFEFAREGSGTFTVVQLALATVVSAIIGWLAIAWLMNWVERGRLHWFAYWVIPLGIGVIIWQLSLRGA